MIDRTDTPVVARVRSVVDDIASDLQLDVYDIEQRGSTLRITLDTPPGSDGGVTLDQLTLATRLINRELDHQDPVPGRYTLEVTSPGVERALRTPAHFQREIGKSVALRLSGVESEDRRVRGILLAADDSTATVQVGDTADEVRVVDLDTIDRARTVFEWGPQPKPGAKSGKSKRRASRSDAKTARRTKDRTGDSADSAPTADQNAESSIAPDRTASLGSHKETS